MSAEYSKNPKNISRDQWEKEMSMNYYMVQGGRKKRYPQALDFPLANKSNLQYTSLRFTKDRRENA